MNGLQDHTIKATLENLDHLNLTGHVLADKVWIGGGGFSDIHVGFLVRTSEGGTSIRVKVAIKNVRFHLIKDSTYAKFFAREIDIWSKLVHENIVRLEGFILDGPYPSLVSVWAGNGTVIEFLKKQQGCDVMEIVSGIANGLAYIHAKGVIHSDLKSDNILMNDSGQPMICDFGLSRMFSYSKSFLATSDKKRSSGTIRWMAYELLNSDDLSAGVATSSEYFLSEDRDLDVVHTQATDMWAFGMIVYEILTLNLPYAHIRNDFAVLFAICNKEIPQKPPLPDSNKEKLWYICTRCWAHSPAERMSVEEFITTLSSNTGIVKIPGRVTRLKSLFESATTNTVSKESEISKRTRSSPSADRVFPPNQVDAQALNDMYHVLTTSGIPSSPLPETMKMSSHVISSTAFPSPPPSPSPSPSSPRNSSLPDLRLITSKGPSLGENAGNLSLQSLQGQECSQVTDPKPSLSAFIGRMSPSKESVLPVVPIAPTPLLPDTATDYPEYAGAFSEEKLSAIGLRASPPSASPETRTSSWITRPFDRERHSTTSKSVSPRRINDSYRKEVSSPDSIPSATDQTELNSNEDSIRRTQAWATDAVTAELKHLFGNSIEKSISKSKSKASHPLFAPPAIERNDDDHAYEHARLVSGSTFLGIDVDASTQPLATHGFYPESIDALPLDTTSLKEQMPYSLSHSFEYTRPIHRVTSSVAMELRPQCSKTIVRQREEDATTLAPIHDVYMHHDSPSSKLGPPEIWNMQDRPPNHAYRSRSVTGSVDECPPHEAIRPVGYMYRRRSASPSIRAASSAGRRITVTTSKRLNIRFGFWNRRGDYLTEAREVVYCPFERSYPPDLADYPNDAFQDHYRNIVYGNPDDFRVDARYSDASSTYASLVKYVVRPNFD